MYQRRDSRWWRSRGALWHEWKSPLILKPGERAKDADACIQRYALLSAFIKILKVDFSLPSPFGSWHFVFDIAHFWPLPTT